jgi:hypothetical protein
MTRDTKTRDFPTAVTFFIEPDGTVVIDSLFGNVLPLAFTLDPDNKQIKKFILHQKRNRYYNKGG